MIDDPSGPTEKHRTALAIPQMATGLEAFLGDRTAESSSSRRRENASRVPCRSTCVAYLGAFSQWAQKRVDAYRVGGRGECSKGSPPWAKDSTAAGTARFLPLRPEVLLSAYAAFGKEDRLTKGILTESNLAFCASSSRPRTPVRRLAGCGPALLTL